MKRMSSPSENDTDRYFHVRRRTSSHALDSDSDQEVVDIIRRLAEHDVHQVAEDDISDEDHVRLDCRVVENLGKDFEFRPHRMQRVLVKVGETCPGWSPARTAELVTSLVGQNDRKDDAIFDLVSHAIKRDSFKHIRRLGA